MPTHKAYGHDPVKAKIYNAYRNLRQVCFNERNPLHQIYVREGVELVCDFDSFNEFYEWVINKLGPPPTLDYSIVRKNMFKGWTRRNLEWNTKQIQQARQRKAVICRYRGKSQCITQWSKELSISPYTIYQRRYSGITDPRLLFKQGRINDKT